MIPPSPWVDDRRGIARTRALRGADPRSISGCGRTICDQAAPATEPAVRVVCCSRRAAALRMRRVRPTVCWSTVALRVGCSSATLHRVGGVGGVEVGADLFGQALGPLVDPAAAHDLHLRAAVDLAEVVDQLAHGGHAAGQRAEHDEQVGADVADQLEHLVLRHAAAGEADGVAVGLEQVGGDLPAELLGLVVAAEDQDVLAVARRRGAGGRVSWSVIERFRRVARFRLLMRDAVFAVQRLEQFHRRPDQAVEQVVGLEARRPRAASITLRAPSRSPARRGSR